MLAKIAIRIKKDWLIILPILAAASSFVISFWLKIILSPEKYGDFAIAFFTVNLLLAIGAIGYDQVIIRLTNLSKIGLQVEKRTVLLGSIIFAFTPFLSFLFLSGFGILNEFSISFLAISYSAAFISVLSILFNLQGKLLNSYLLLGWWKIMLLVLLIVFFIFDMRYENIENLIYFSLVSTLGIAIFFCRGVVLIVESNLGIRSHIILYLASLISFVSFQSFDNLDRFLLATNFDKSTFGNYFFVFNFIMMPASIFISYFSVKKLSKYKSEFSYDSLKSDFYRVLLFSSLFAVLSLFCLVFLKELGFVSYGSLSFYTLVLVSLLCVLKSSYIILSSAYKVVASKKTLINTSVIFGLVSVLLYFSLSYGVFFESVSDIVVVVLLLWVFRVYYYLFIIKSDSRLL